MDNTSSGIMPPPTIPLVTHQPLPTASDLLKSSFAYSKSKLHLTLSIIAVPFVLQAIQVLGAPYFPVVISYIVNIVVFIASLFMGFAMVFIMTRRDVEVSSATQAYSLSRQYVIPGVWIAVLSSLVILGSFSLLIIPGIVMGGFMLLSSYALYVEGKRGFSALSLSWHYVSGYWSAVVWRIFVLGLVMFGCLLLAIIAFGIVGFVIGLLAYTGGATVSSVSGQILQGITSLLMTFIVWVYLMPVSYAYYADLYQALRYVKLSEPITETEEKNKKWKLIVLLVLGIFAFVVLIVLFGALLLLLSGFTDLKSSSVPMLPSKQILNIGTFPFVGNAAFAQLLQLYK